MNISITKATEYLHSIRKQLSWKVNESSSINAGMALRLEQGFNVEARFSMDLQTKYDLWKLKSTKK